MSAESFVTLPPSPKNFQELVTLKETRNLGGMPEPDGSKREIESKPETDRKESHSTIALVHPIRLMAMMVGEIRATRDLRADCDELTALWASVASFLGAPIEFVTVATDPSKRHEFNHVYPQLVVDRFRLPIDFLSGPPGVEPKNVYRRKVWSSSSKSRTFPNDEPVEQAIQQISIAAVASAKHPAMEEFVRDLAVAGFAVFRAMATIEIQGRSLGFPPPYFPWFSIEQIVSARESLDSALQKLCQGEPVRAVLDDISLFPGAALGPAEIEKLMKTLFHCIGLWAASGVVGEIEDYFRARWPNLRY
jgi:hypothetical protein